MIFPRKFWFLSPVAILLCALWTGARAQTQETGRQGATADGQTAAVSSGGIASAADEWQRITVGFVGRNRYEPQTAAALAGARAAAAALGPQYRLHVTVVPRSPSGASAQAQNEALSSLFVEGAAGVLINPVDAAGLANVLSLLQRQRMPVVTFANAYPLADVSGRVVDDQAAIGQALASEGFYFLSQLRIQQRARIAILTAEQGAEPYAERGQAAQQLIDSSPNYTTYGVYRAPDSFGGALELLGQVTGAERGESLNLWLSTGDWPLQGLHADLPRRRGLVGFVVAGGLPSQLPYLARGEVLSLVSPDYYRVGYEAMRLVIEAQPGQGKAAGTVAGILLPAEQAAAETAGAKAATEEILPAQSVRQLTVPPRIIRRQGAADYAAQWAVWLSQPM